MRPALSNASIDRATGDDAKLARILEEYLAAFEAGRAPPRESLLAAHPQLADRIERCLESLRFVQSAMAVMAAPSADGQADRSLAGELGDFRLLREIGRGGMGVVYEAEQISLSRRVALKVLPFAAVLDERQLQRFKNEALAAATLDHPHIVDVHGIGCERGMHFYVMRLIDGATLADALSSGRRGGNSEHDRDTVAIAGLATLRTEQPAAFFRRVAELGIQAADALEHAHQLGVVHRDIKPSNLLLDRGAKLWITDFGLAQVESHATLTMPGEVLGTLRYMSPEQAAGRPTMIDHRTDLYSLGATLYELATDQPAVRGQDRAAILREIAETEPVRPRAIQPAMPLDLETILLKCLAKEPAARYDTAQALADDLRRFLEQQPIRARRTTSLQRLRYWAQRRPAVAALVAAVVIAMALGFAGTSLGWLTASRRAEEYRALLYRADVASALEAWRIGDARKVHEILARHIPRDGENDLRGFEWNYLWRKVHETGAERVFPHDQPVVQLAFLDGRQVAARMLRGEIRILDIEQGTSRRPTADEFATTLPPTFHGGRENWAYFFALNDTAEAIERNSIAADMRDVTRQFELWNPIVSPAGNLFAGGTYTREARLVERASKKVRATLKGHEGILLSLAFSPDGELLATAGNDGKAMVWKTSDGTRVAAIAAHAGTCGCAVFSPDGHWLATSGRDECIRIWDASTFTKLHQIDVPGETNYVTFSPDRRLMAAAGNASIIYVWRTNDWSLVQTLKGHSGSTNVLCFSPDGRRLASGAGDGDARIWWVDQPSTDVPWFAVNGEARSLAFHPRRNVLASGSWGGSTQLWDVERRAPVAELEHRGERVLTVVFDPAGELLAAAGDGDVIRIFDVGDGRQRSILKTNENGVASIAFSSSGDLVACGQSAVYVWERKEFLNKPEVAAATHRFEAKSYPQALALSRDGRRLLLANGGSPAFELRQLPEGNVIAQSAAGGGNVNMAAASSSREDIFATGARDGTIRVWEDHTLACRHVLRGHSSYVIGLAFSPSEDILASASLDGTVRIWDTITGAERAAFAGHTIGASSVAFSHVGDMLATGDLKGNIRLFVAARAADVARELARSSSYARDRNPVPPPTIELP